jgi:hypothetical protein
MSASVFVLLLLAPLVGLGYVALNVWLVYRLSKLRRKALVRWRHLKFFFSWELYRRFPRLKREEAKIREHTAERDREMNEKTRLPVDEDVALLAMWGTEVFGPAEIDAFYANLRRLQWDEGGKMANRSASAWIAEQRMYGSTGTFNLNVVTRTGDARFIGIDYTARLPDEVDYIIAELQQFSPSFTCVTIAFVFKEDLARLYREELLRDRQTERRAVPKSRAVAHHAVDSLKREAIQEIRERCRSIVTGWFREFMPGYFSQSEQGSRLPTSELTTTLKTEILHDSNAGLIEARRNYEKWSQQVCPKSYFREAWTSLAFPALKIAVDCFEGDARYHSFMQLTANRVTEEELKHLGPKGSRAHIYLANEHITGTLACYAIFALLSEANKAVKTSREELKMGKRTQKGKKVLDGIRQAFRIFAGLTSAVDELAQFAAEKRLYDYHCGSYVQQGSGPHAGKTFYLGEALRQRTRQLAERLNKDEAAARELFEQLASVVSIQESIRAQRRMEILTYVALFVAVASLLAALPPVKEWRKDLQAFASCMHQ